MQDKKFVFDTTVLSNFLFAGEISLLINRYRGRGIISWQVYDELSAGYKKKPILQNIEQLFVNGHFDLVTLSNKEHKFYLSLLDVLGKGEASCLAVAQRSRIFVVSDDKAARRLCEAHKIKFTGTIGILIAACQDRVIEITQADIILSSMIDAGFYSPVSKISDLH